MYWEELKIPIDRLGGPQAQSECGAKRKILPLPGIKVHHQSLYYYRY
jgi:hypothetical protein